MNNDIPSGKENSDNFNWQIAEVLDSINVGFFSRDLITDKYLRLSEGLPRIYGYDLSRFYTNSSLWYEVIVDEDKHVTQAEMLQLNSGNKSVAQYRIHHFDGSVRWLEVKTFPVFEGGALIRVEGIVYDITERKIAELQTIEAKELSESIINSLPGIFYLYDEEGNYLSWNKNLERVTGFSADEIRTLTPLSIICVEDQMLVKNAIEQVFNTGQGEVEARLVNKEGQTFLYYFNGQKVNIGGQNCLAGMGLDITERKTAEESLQKNERMLSHILDLIPQSIFWKDAHCNFMGGNQVFAKLVGADDVKSIIGKNDYDLSSTAEEARKYQQDDLEVMKRKEARMHYVETQTHNNGESIWLDTTKIPLIDQNDQVYGILVVINDITEKKLKDDNQRKINEELTKKNIELTDFSYMVSHQLRAPACKILGLASLFDGEEPNADLNKELIGHIINEVTYLDSIIKDMNMILSYQIPLGKLIEMVSLEDLINDSKEYLETALVQSAAQVLYDFNEVKMVRTVKSYLFNIFNNLISNAVRYKHPDRTPIIKVESYHTGEYTCITFQDNGLGFDLEKYGDKIFQIYNNFHQGSPQGKGIGLKLVKTQSEALGGKIELQSSLGHGSVFKIFLPMS
jgi:PAS domain S-box-containing protein